MKKKSRKLIRWCQIDRLAEGYKRTIDEIWGPIEKKNDFFGKNPNFGAKKEHTHLSPNHVLAMTKQSSTKKKVPFPQINVSLLADFECFFCVEKNGFSAHFPLSSKP